MEATRSNLAQQILTDIDFPDPYRTGSSSTLSTLKFEVPGSSDSFLYWIEWEGSAGGDMHLFPHIKWVQSGSGQNIPSSTLDTFLTEVAGKFPDNPVFGITGRIISPPVFDLTERIFQKQGWPTYILLGGSAVNLDCAGYGNCQGEFTELLRTRTEVGAPFVAFNPELKVEA